MFVMKMDNESTPSPRARAFEQKQKAKQTNKQTKTEKMLSTKCP